MESHEIQHVAVQPAAEATEALTVCVHGETGSALLVERAQPDEARRARTAQLNAGSLDHFLDRIRLLDGADINCRSRKCGHAKTPIETAPVRRTERSDA